MISTEELPEIRPQRSEGCYGADADALRTRRSQKTAERIRRVGRFWVAAVSLAAIVFFLVLQVPLSSGTRFSPNQNGKSVAVAMTSTVGDAVPGFRCT